MTDPRNDGSAVGGLPRVSDVVATFRQVLHDDSQAQADGLLGLLVALHRINAAQWELEDEVRAPGASDATVAAAKRGIDRLNSLRHHHVEKVDAAISDVIAPAPDAPPSTESPGMAFDRLSVLVIRIHFTELASRLAAPGDTGYERRLPSISSQLTSLESALEVFLDDLVVGTRRFQPYQSLKLYGS